MMAILDGGGASLALFIIHNVLGMEVDPSAQSVLEIQPGKIFHFVRNMNSPYAQPMDIWSLLVIAQCLVCITGCIGLSSEFHQPDICAIS
jgi:hypothetical protein